MGESDPIGLSSSLECQTTSVSASAEEAPFACLVCRETAGSTRPHLVSVEPDDGRGP